YRSVARDQHRLDLLVDAAAEHIDAGGLGFLDHRMSVGGDLGHFLVGDNHRLARKGDEVFRHVTTCHVRIARNTSPKIATHASAILSQSAMGNRRASSELSTRVNAPANHSIWTTLSPFITAPPARHSPVRPPRAIPPQGRHSPSYCPYA